MEIVSVGHTFTPENRVGFYLALQNRKPAPAWIIILRAQNCFMDARGCHFLFTGKQLKELMEGKGVRESREDSRWKKMIHLGGWAWLVCKYHNSRSSRVTRHNDTNHYLSLQDTGKFFFLILIFSPILCT